MWPPFAFRQIRVVLGLLMGLERRVHLRDRILLHARQHVAVQVERDADLAVTEPLAGDLHMDARGQHVRGVAVPQIVEADAGQALARNCLQPFMGEAVRLDAFAGSRGADQRVAGRPDAKPQQFLGLLTRHARSSSTTSADRLTLRVRPRLGSV